MCCHRIQLEKEVRALLVLIAFCEFQLKHVIIMVCLGPAITIMICLVKVINFRRWDWAHTVNLIECFHIMDTHLGTSISVGYLMCFGIFRIHS